MRNVEIKARVHDVDKIIEIAAKLSDSSGTVIKQDDTFYNATNGRLKMRFYDDSAATLVRYDREDAEGPKMSEYELLHFAKEDSQKAKLLDEMLAKCLGKKGRVQKER